MPSFVFPGYPAYLEAAAAQLERPEHARHAGRSVALTALANLCAQASRADSSQVPAILAKATEFRDQLDIALRAADAMLADVGAARTNPRPIPRADLARTPGPAIAPGVGRAGARKTVSEVIV